jgi:hypothetical protein
LHFSGDGRTAHVALQQVVPELAAFIELENQLQSQGINYVKVSGM